MMLKHPHPGAMKGVSAWLHWRAAGVPELPANPVFFVLQSDKKAFIAQILLYFQKLVRSHKNMSWSFDNFNLVWSWGERKQKRETSSLVFWIYSNFSNSTSTHIPAIFEKKDPAHLIQTSKSCLYLLCLFPTLLPQLWAHSRHSVNNFE